MKPTITPDPDPRSPGPSHGVPDFHRLVPRRGRHLDTGKGNFSGIFGWVPAEWFGSGKLGYSSNLIMFIISCKCQTEFGFGDCVGLANSVLTK